MIKILAIRLKPLLCYLVDENQSAFTKGRSIQDNILLTYELVKNYQKSNGSRRCAIKIDIIKGFDILN